MKGRIFPAQNVISQTAHAKYYGKSTKIKLRAGSTLRMGHDHRLRRLHEKFPKCYLCWQMNKSSFTPSNTKMTFTYSNSTMEKLGKGVIHVQS